MSKMKNLMGEAALIVAKQKGWNLERSTDWLMNQLGSTEETREVYEARLAYSRAIRLHAPAQETPGTIEILEQVLSDGWCVGTEQIMYTNDVALLRTYGLIDILGHEYVLPVKLSEAQEGIDKLKVDIGLKLSKLRGENRTESDLEDTGLPGRSNLHLHAQTPERSNLQSSGKTDPTNLDENPALGTLDYVLPTEGLTNTSKRVAPQLIRYNYHPVYNSTSLLLEGCNKWMHICMLPRYRPLKAKESGVETIVKGLKKYRNEKDCLTIELVSPLRMLEVVPHRLLSSNTVSSGQWTVIEFIANHLVK